jgi:asparagine synthase (glutamine-hydrolysing)
LFGGYNRYKAANRAWGFLSKAPRSVRQLAGRSISAINPQTWDRIGGDLARRHVRNFGDKVHKAAGALTSDSLWALYFHLVSAVPDYRRWLNQDSNIHWEDRFRQIEKQDLVGPELMMALDAMTYLPDDILVKLDRASMAVSLESRVPFLDHRVIEYAWSLPLDYKIRHGETKWPLRQLLDRYLPRELMDRPKMGFAIPLAEWLRGPLREWASDLLSPQRISAGGRWNAGEVERAWTEHLSGRRNLSAKIWPVLMFEAWIEQNATPHPHTLMVA